MVAYNFQPWLAPPIQAGTKVHTIRTRGNRRHARTGEMLQLYTGMRRGRLGAAAYLWRQCRRQAIERAAGISG